MPWQTLFKETDVSILHSAIYIQYIHNNLPRDAHTSIFFEKKKNTKTQQSPLDNLAFLYLCRGLGSQSLRVSRF